MTEPERLLPAERVAFDHLVLIKGHMLSLLRFLRTRDDQSFRPPDVVDLRHAFIDVRMVIEELLLLSVSAHQDMGEQISRSFRTGYQADKKLGELRRVNPHFFPVAIGIVPSNEPGIDGQFIDVTDPYLTEADVKEIYTSAGDRLHSKRKPFNKAEFDVDVGLVERFTTLAARLLDTFEVDISGRGHIIVGHLKLAEDGPPALFTAPIHKDDATAPGATHLIVS